MNGEEEKYNNKKARYIARLVLQNRFNKNLGMSYERAVRENCAFKSSIDYWIERMEKAAKKGGKNGDYGCCEPFVRGGGNCDGHIDITQGVEKGY